MYVKGWCKYMASKTLDEIRRAEAEAINRQKMAQNSAEQALKKAKADAEQTLQSAEQNANGQAAQMREATVAECDRLYSDNLREADALCEALAATADNNRNKVIDLVIDSVTQGQTD